MKINTTRFGEINIDENKIIRFPNGILGFSEVKNYIMLDHMNKPDIPFKWLQAIDRSDLAFVITDPLLFNPDYNPNIGEQDLKEVDLTTAEDKGMIVIVTIPGDDPQKMTANLRGPILVNLRMKVAKQIVLPDDNYQVRFPLLESLPALKS